MSLQTRIALALCGLAAVVSLLATLGTWYGHAQLEQELLDSVLDRELSAHLEAGGAPPRLSAQRRGVILMRPALFPDGRFTAELAALEPGSYRDFDLDDRHRFHVVVRELAPGDRAYLLYEVTGLERREQWLRASVAGGIALALALAWIAAGLIARRLLRPLHGVVQRIESVDPERREPLPARPEEGDLAPVVAAVNRLLGEIDRYVQRERAFAAAAGHELRTPLTSIRLAAQSIAAGLDSAGPLARIDRAVDGASQTLDALLALSRGRELPEPQDLALDRLLPVLAQPYESAARDAGTALAWRLQPASVRGPVGILGVIFTNLLRNAIRAAPGGTVIIEVTPGAIRVIDDGEGIDATMLEQVFEPGVRGRSGGSGIGLYISRELARRCGWDLSVRNNEARGVTAELRFP